MRRDYTPPDANMVFQGHGSIIIIIIIISLLAGLMLFPGKIIPGYFLISHHATIADTNQLPSVLQLLSSL